MDLRGAVLRSADLRDANLFKADLRGADLREADLGGASLFLANLSDADLSDADLSGANLALANLRSAHLADADLSRARLVVADVTHAHLGLKSYPPIQNLISMKGLSTIQFDPDDEPNLVQLRNRLNEAGLRDLEREATFAIEHNRTVDSILSVRASPLLAAEGVFRLVAFEWTTGYGLHPGRALLLIVVFWVLLTPFYLRLIARTHAFPNPPSAIYRVRPKERITDSDGKVTQAGEDLVERLHARGRTAVGYAAYFSLLSAFHLGFREFNVGTWIARVQAHPYELVPTGRARVVSGLQSLLSLYLLAMWALTYFGRPFE